MKNEFKEIDDVNLAIKHSRDRLEQGVKSLKESLEEN